MPMNAIIQITRAEEECKRNKAEALAAAKKRISDARQAGEEALRAACFEAENHVKDRLARAETQGALRSAERAAQAKRECAALRRTAEARLENAAVLIVKNIAEG